MKLVSLITKREGKKTSVSVGNVREILKCLVEIEAEYRAKHGVVSPDWEELEARIEKKARRVQNAQ